MFTARSKRTATIVGLFAAASLLLTACGTTADIEGTPSSDPSASAADGPIVVGSQAYYSNEIIAEIYAQALENGGFDVKRQFNIGQRDAYMPELISGAIDLFPEYTGNLLEFLDDSAEATDPDDVYAELQKALPEGLTALEFADATDQDTYTVTKAFASENNLTSIGDLATLSSPATIGAAPEFEQRPYGPQGAKDIYGVDLKFSATGPTTLASLIADTIQVGDIYSADPAFEIEEIVALTDPKHMILSSNVVPIASSDIAAEIADILNAISAKLTTPELISLNVQSAVDQKSTPAIATAWLTDNGLLK